MRSDKQVARATAREKLAAWMTVQPRTIEQIRQFLGAHFGRPIPRRTAERYRDWMVDGYGATTKHTWDKHKGWIVEKKQRALPVDIEQRQLARCRRAADWLQREGKAQWSSALNELLAGIGASDLSQAGTRAGTLETVAVRPGPHVRVLSWVESILQRAMAMDRAIRARYRLTKRRDITTGQGLTIDAVIHPYGLIYTDRTFLVGGYDEKGRLQRDARGQRKIGWYLLDRFESIQIVDLPLLGRSTFDLNAYVQQWFGTPRGDEEPFDVEWRFSPQVADRAALYHFHPTQSMKREKNGSLLVTFRAAGSLEMDWHLHTWGDDVEVIHPPPREFAAKVKEQRKQWREYFR